MSSKNECENAFFSLTQEDACFYSILQDRRSQFGELLGSQPAIQKLNWTRLEFPRIVWPVLATILKQKNKKMLTMT